VCIDFDGRTPHHSNIFQVMKLAYLVHLFLVKTPSTISSSNKHKIDRLCSYRNMSTGRGRGGRGEYYKNKYGGGGGGRGRGAGAGRGQTEQQPDHKRGETAGGTSVDLYRLLESINGSQYGAYHGIETRNGWRFSSFSLFIERAQSDPFAAPTRVRLLIPHTRAGLPSSLYSNKTRSLGLSDYLHRSLHDYCKEIGVGVGLAGTGSWSGPKGGDLAIFPPCQHVLEQTAVRIRPSGDVVIQMTLNLPARGRTILGQAAVQTIETLASLVENTMQYWNTSLKSDKIEKYVDSIEDQVWLQSQLDSQGLAAFVRNGAILPRLSGADDRPMDSETAIPFQSPPTLHTSFKLPNSGITIHGMGLRKGISIVVGGGFHGKSTLLEALQVGVYPKVPGDGREFVVTSPTAMKIRAEDGRPITAVDISPFIGNLPFGRDTSCFSTPDASGSTSQAANIVEVS
jgi:predicted ABC-class ATPase